MSIRPLLVLSLEAFSPAAIACYGSSWNNTPALDAIAAQSCVYDRWLIGEDDPHQPLVRLFEDARQWLRPFSELGATELITDVDEIAKVANTSATSFDQVSKVPIPESVTIPSEIDETHLATLVAEMMERDQALDGEWGLMWLHTSVLAHLWDAPRELFPIDEVEQDEEASFPLIVDDARVPKILPDTDFSPSDWWQSLGDTGEDLRTHPDFVNSWMRTYGCQVRLLDFLVEVLLEALEDNDPRILITGTSGFQLGQSGVIGCGIGTLRSPQLHVPMMVSDLPAIRMPGVQSDRSLETILHALSIGDHAMFGPCAWSEPNSDNHQVRTLSPRAPQVVNTSSWFYVQDEDESEHLFLKPDDANDCNDVASLRPDVIDDLREVQSDRK